MKKILCLIASLVILLSFTACASDDIAQLYYNYDMNDYIDVGEYSLSIDRNSDDYKKMYREFYKDAFGDTLSYTVKKGEVMEGDKVSINYDGKYKGEDFDGGTEYNYTLTIGDGGFTVEGFEKNIIGTPIGGEVTFKATLPDSYHNKSLAGKVVTYTVYVNSITRYPEPTDEEAKAAGFASYEDYHKQADDFAIGVCVFNNIYDNSKILSYPEKETEQLIKVLYDDYVEKYAEMGVTVESYVASVDWTMEQFNTHLKDSVQKDWRKMPRDLLSYYLLQVNDEKLTQEEMFDFVDIVSEKYGIDKESITDIELERMAVYEKALKVCRQMAEVK